MRWTIAIVVLASCLALGMIYLYLRRRNAREALELHRLAEAELHVAALIEHEETLRTEAERKFSSSATHRFTPYHERKLLQQIKERMRYERGLK